METIVGQNPSLVPDIDSNQTMVVFASALVFFLEILNTVFHFWIVQSCVGYGSA